MIVLSVSAALRMIALPVVVSPVNATLSMPGCSTSAWPTVEPGPVMTFRTPGGKPDLDRNLAERDRRQRRLAGRLEDDGVAARQRRRDLPRRQQQRKIPRHDGGDDANRLAQRVGEVVALDGDGLAHHLVGPAGEVLEALRRRRNLDVPRLADRLAVVKRLEPRDLVGSLHQPIGQPADQPAPLSGRHLAPRARRAPPAPPPRPRRRRPPRPTRPTQSPLRSPD